MKRIFFIVAMIVLFSFGCQNYAKEDVYAYYTSSMQFHNDTATPIVIELKHVGVSRGSYILAPGETISTFNWYFKTSGEYADEMNVFISGGQYGVFLFHNADKEKYIFTITQSDYLTDCIRETVSNI